MASNVPYVAKTWQRGTQRWLTLPLEKSWKPVHVLKPYALRPRRPGWEGIPRGWRQRPRPGCGAGGGAPASSRMWRGWPAVSLVVMR